MQIKNIYKVVVEMKWKDEDNSIIHTSEVFDILADSSDDAKKIVVSMLEDEGEVTDIKVKDILESESILRYLTHNKSDKIDNYNDFESYLKEFDD